MFNKVVVVTGDVSEEGLGLSEADRAKIISNVNLVFHGAATLDFDADLRSNVNINLLGTKRVLELCGQLRNCLVRILFSSFTESNRVLNNPYSQGMLHISSAYVNSDLVEVDEKLYPPPEDADKIIELTKSLDETSVNIITKK